MHKLLSTETGAQVLMLGNEAIARGALEAGVAFATTYPGTPSSEISLNLFQVSRETDLYFEPPLGQFKLLDFQALEKIVDVGYHYAQEKINELKENAMFKNLFE